MVCSMQVVVGGVGVCCLGTSCNFEEVEIRFSALRPLEVEHESGITLSPNLDSNVLAFTVF